MEIIAELVGAILGLILVIYLLAIPGRIAKQRDHSKADAIRVCGFASILLPVLWIVALVWAYTEDNRRPEKPVIRRAAQSPKAVDW